MATIVTERRMKKDNYISLPQEEFEAISRRFDIFRDNMSDPIAPTVKVYNDHGPKQHEELLLIREVSQELQAKKEEDMKKAAQAAAAAEEERKLELEKKAEEEKQKEAEGEAKDEEKKEE